jgi:hypothetical protein
MVERLAHCLVCASTEVVVGTRFNPNIGGPAIYGNFCRPCITTFIAPVPKKNWSGQYGGTNAHETMCFYDPFTKQELEAFHLDGALE